MECPNDGEQLEEILFHNVGVDYCPRCLGMWFDKDELRQAKDEKDKQLNWLDVDLWRDKGRFRVSKGNKHCPVDRAGLVEVKYDESKTKVDLCKMCQGVWLDRGEFKQIINYLKNKSDHVILNNYAENLLSELWEAAISKIIFIFFLQKIVNSRHQFFRFAIFRIPRIFGNYFRIFKQCNCNYFKKSSWC